MRPARWMALLSLPICFALSPGRAGAQASLPSDTLYETIQDQTGKTLLKRPPFTLPEGGAEKGTFTIPALTVDFLEAGSTPTNIVRSDRFHFDSFTVQVTSDSEANLPPRDPNDVTKPPLFLIPSDQFTVLSFGFSSDDDANGETPGGTSDTLQIGLGFGLTITVPTTENATEQTFKQTFNVDATRYDLQGPAEPGDQVSDYVDLLPKDPRTSSAITGFILSTNTQASYPGTGDVSIDEARGLQYNLVFTSTPESGSLSLLLSGLSVLGVCVWRRRRA